MTLIAQFIDSRHFGGAERVVLDLCTHLPDYGYRPLVLQFGNERLEQACADLGIPCERLPRDRGYQSKWTVAAFAVSLARHLRRQQVALVHSHLLGAVTAGSVAAALARLPHLGTLHDTHTVEERPALFRLLRFSAALGTTMVTVAESMRTYYARLGPRIPFRRIYNGIDVEQFPRAGEPSKPFTLITVGRLAEVKRHDLLLDALARVRLPVRLRIVGEGPLREALERRVRELQLETRVEFLGFRTDIPPLLARAHAFILSSRSEGLSCSLMEAMACGLPIIATDVGGNHELVERGRTGLLVRSGDADAIAAAIDELAADPARTKAMGAAARARAEQRFSVSRMVRDYDDIYRALLPAKPALRHA